MRIGYLRDGDGQAIGGAELSADALVQAAPDGVEMVYIPPGQMPVAECDAFLVFNCVTYDNDVIAYMDGKPVIKRVADYWPHGDDDLRAWLLEKSRRLVFLSKPHLEAFPYTCGTKTVLCPPPIDVERFRRAGMNNKQREGAFWMGQMWYHKGIQEAVVWAEQAGQKVDFYGDGPLRPRESAFCRYAGQVPYEDVPFVMATYDVFLHVPVWVEPFGRTVIEAWAAGCKLYLNDRIGAAWWLDNDMDAVNNGAERFWQIVEETL